MTTGDYNIFGRDMTDELAQRPRVFISRRVAHEPTARALARYFEFLTLHYYLDEEDDGLQNLRAEGHSYARATRGRRWGRHRCDC